MQAYSEVMEKLRLDELARRANVASTTVRLYQSKGLLAPPYLEGRVGWYDETHLSRLRIIARLQAEGHSLAGIRDLLDQWERGRGLEAVIGVETQLDALLGDAHAVVVDPTELFSRFPDGAMTPELMQRAFTLGLVAPNDDGRIRVADRRFVDTGAALAHLGVPLDVVLDEWEALVEHTDKIAGRFVTVFEEHLAPANWQTELAPDEIRELANTLARLQALARQVVLAALDASVAKLSRERLGQLVVER